MDTAEKLHQTLRELEALGDESPVLDTIRETVLSAASLYGVTGAGVMFIDEDNVLHYAAASDGHSRELEQAETRAGLGPCVQALVNNEIVKTENILEDERWPELHDDLRPTRVRAVVGIPIHIGGNVAGSLDAYRDAPHVWLDSEIDGLVQYARLIERILLTALRAQENEKTVRQLEHALEHRVVIERAVGVLMERHGLSAVDAFERLRSAARSSRRRAAEIALEILATAGSSSG